jgi:mRNA interferase MazF
MKRAEIWLINLDPTLGAEIKKTRPAVIVNDDSLGILPLRVIVPITDWKPHYDSAIWMVKIETDAQNNLTKTSSADCFQIRSVSKMRFVRKIGEVSDEVMSDIEEGLAKILKIG